MNKRCAQWHELTYYERVLVRLAVWEGLNNASLAARLTIPYSTAKNIMTHIYHKIGLPERHRGKRVALVRWAWQQPLWQSEDDLVGVA